MKKVLNVGGNSKAIALPKQYAGYEHLLLDIDPTGQPDVLCDARELDKLAASSFDAVYCSHNLEHYHHHDVRKVLSGFFHVLKPGGFAHIIVPDLASVMRTVVEKKLDVEDVLYQSGMGPIKVIDVLYGHGAQIERSGQDFFSHKTGFTEKSLLLALQKAGFVNLHSSCHGFAVTALAFKEHVDQQALSSFIG